MHSIYQPSDDSYLFSEFLKNKIKDKEISFLDMGCGSCILAETAKNLGINDITCVDINLEAIKEAKKKKFIAIHSDLFDKLNKEKKFDIICFNAPYLPLDKNEPIDSRIATTGGKRGDEISLKFINQAKKYLKENGKIYLLISSLTPFERIEKFNPKIVSKKRIFGENLLILEINQNH